MATYARLSSVFAPVMDRARRWSQSSATSEQRPAFDPPDRDGTASSSADSEMLAPPSLLPALSESSAIDMEDAASEQTLVAVDPPAALRPPVPSTDTDHPPPRSPPSMPPPEGPVQHASATNTSPGAIPVKSNALPENDGQSVLRQRLIEIAHSEVSERERAVRMHQLMTEKWEASQAARDMVDPNSPRSPRFATAEQSLEESKNNPYKLLPGDTTKTYYSGPGENSDDSVSLGLGCAHYHRGVKLQCSTCERWHTCRFCHDENEDHALVRRETKNMLCMHCGQPQPAQQDCRHCGMRSARYYCDKCKLWDDDPEKSIYHCNDCGICRIGKGLGKDFFHCKKCGVCMSITLENSHRCIERSTECDCPICGEFMFTSTLTVVFMTCGHSIHHKCYYEHMKNSYRCPTCARTIINMEAQFRALDSEIENQPLPAPYNAWRCLISCNDCSAKSNVPFHFLGLKCTNCSSYNTSQVRILRPEDGPTTDGNPPPDNLMSPSPLAPGLDLMSNIRQLASAPIAAAVDSRPESRVGDDERTLDVANRAIAAAEEAIEVTMGMDHGDEDLIVDDGWETEDSEEFDEDMEEEDAMDLEEESDDEDDDDGELIQLIGHL